MTFRERLLENFANNLEYHPKRGMLYLGLGVAAVCFWVFVPSENKLTATPLVFGGGGVTLLLKGVLFLRKSSEGLALTQHELAQLSDPSTRKSLPPIPTLAAQ